jgi:hypothetical protein
MVQTLVTRTRTLEGEQAVRSDKTLASTTLNAAVNSLMVKNTVLDGVFCISRKRVLDGVFDCLLNQFPLSLLVPSLETGRVRSSGF